MVLLGVSLLETCLEPFPLLTLLTLRQNTYVRSRWGTGITVGFVQPNLRVVVQETSSIYVYIYIHISPTDSKNSPAGTCLLKKKHPDFPKPKNIPTCNPKQPFINGCFSWMIPNLYIGTGCFTKHPFINGCLGFQEDILHDLNLEGKIHQSFMFHPSFFWW